MIELQSNSATTIDKAKDKLEEMELKYNERKGWRFVVSLAFFVVFFVSGIWVVP